MQERDDEIVKRHILHDPDSQLIVRFAKVFSGSSQGISKDFLYLVYR